MVARLSTIPFALAATLIASEVRQTGYLLVVAFDIMFAAVVAPLFGCFYATNPSPRAALLAVCCGVITRIVLEFALPKDSFLILPVSIVTLFVVVRGVQIAAQGSLTFAYSGCCLILLPIVAVQLP